MVLAFYLLKSKSEILQDFSLETFSSSVIVFADMVRKG